MHLESRRLTLPEQELLRKGEGEGGLPDPLLTRQAVGMAKPCRRPLGSQGANRPLVAGNPLEAHDGLGFGGPPAFGRWHRAHLNKSFLDRERRASYPVGVFG